MMSSKLVVVGVSVASFVGAFAYAAYECHCYNKDQYDLEEDAKHFSFEKEEKEDEIKKNDDELCKLEKIRKAMDEDLEKLIHFVPVDDTSVNKLYDEYSSKVDETLEILRSL